MVAVWLLDDEERRESLREEGLALQSAFYTNYAMNAPKELSAAARRYDAKVIIPPLGIGSIENQGLRDAREQLKTVRRD